MTSLGAGLSGVGHCCGAWTMGRAAIIHAEAQARKATRTAKTDRMTRSVRRSYPKGDLEEKGEIDEGKSCEMNLCRIPSNIPSAELTESNVKSD